MYKNSEYSPKNSQNHRIQTNMSATFSFNTINHGLLRNSYFCKFCWNSSFLRKFMIPKKGLGPVHIGLGPFSYTKIQQQGEISVMWACDRRFNFETWRESDLTTETKGIRFTTSDSRLKVKINFRHWKLNGISW